jgi:tRNA threonylcarbamoyladenosine biosynthesis protein TsaB
MIILSLRTDNPEAEIGLYDNNKKLVADAWMAHRQLAETLHQKINALLAQHNKDWHDIEAIVVFQGPGSFTGLRIGLSVANALASSLTVPIVGAQGADWQAVGISRLLSGSDDRQVMPEYGAPVHITAPKH